jgi:hypothetical protein
MDEVNSPGWQAIDDALLPHYGETQPVHVAYSPSPPFSTNLQGCSACAAAGHWHYITYRLSELYEPQPEDDPAISKWGFELTFRLRRGNEDAPPHWPFVILNRLANFINEGTMGALAPGSRVNLRSPITGYPNEPGAPDTKLTALAATIDPELR